MFAAHRPPEWSGPKVWLLVLLVVCVVLGAMEWFWRQHDITPGVRNTPENWALEVNRWLEHEEDNQAIVLLGSSRIQCGVDPDLLSSSLHDVSVYNLSIGGTRSLDALEFLAEQPAFKGVVVVEIWPLVQLGQQDQTPYLEKWKLFVNGFEQPTASQHLEARFDRALESRMRLLHGELNLNQVATRVLRTRKVLYPLESMLENRYTPLDFKRHDPVRVLRTEQKHKAQFGEMERLDEESLRAVLDRFEQASNKLRARGTRVVFFHPVVSGKTREREDEIFDTTQPWFGRLEQMSDEVVMYAEFDELNTLTCPDEIHLDRSQVSLQTNILAQELARLLAPKL